MEERLDRELRELEARLGEMEAEDERVRERLIHFRRCMARYGDMSPKEREAAARRLAAGESTAVDRIKAAEAAKDLGLDPPPETEASRAAIERRMRRSSGE